MANGVDSLAATELRGILQQELGSSVKLPGTVIFTYPTPSALAQFIGQQRMCSSKIPQSVPTRTSLPDAKAPHLSNTCRSSLLLSGTKCAETWYKYTLTGAHSDKVYQMLKPHVFDGKVLASASMHLDFVHMICMKTTGSPHTWLSDISIVEPLFLDQADNCSIDYHCKLDVDTCSFQLFSSCKAGDFEEKVHSTGNVDTAVPVEFEACMSRLKQLLTMTSQMECVELHTDLLKWSPVRPLWRNQSTAVGKISQDTFTEGFCVHPAALSCLPSLAMLFAHDGMTPLPYHIQSVGLLSQSNVANLWCSMEVYTTAVGF